MKEPNRSGPILLITGGAGFIGSNFISYYLQKYPAATLVNLDKLTYAGDLANLREVENNDRYIFIEGDICDRTLLQNLFREYAFDGIINFAAESHVDNSIDRPADFIRTNIEGTFALLEAARYFWDPYPGKSQQYRFHQISTDEVYGSLGREGKFTEETAYAPNSPYSASKASADFLVRSYHHTYGLNVVTSNCSNNFGPKQHNEKLIPTIIRSAASGQPIPIYGDGSNVRDWLFVEDHCRAIDLVFNQGQTGHTYLIGGNNEYNNLYIAREVCALMDEIRPLPKGSHSDLISFVEDRPGHDFRYAIDATKIERDLGWKSEVGFEAGLRHTVEWYLEKYSQL